MKIKILGCGAAPGVPSLSKGWGSCDPNNTKNRRYRTSALISIDNKNILIDTGPDLRSQLLEANTNVIDAVLYTHEHADHTHGVDDLREINRVTRKCLPIYANKKTLDLLKDRFSYVFNAVDKNSGIFFHPWLEPNLITPGEPFYFENIKITPFAQDHEWTTTIGYRIGNFAYSTDVVKFYDSSMKMLEGIDTWILGCLSAKEHPSHASINNVIAWKNIVKAKRVILTHMGTSMDYDTLMKELPEGIEPAYDGMEIEVK
ncbi:MAG: MBL fold metallo-hydrolase [Alphaproteobacteria bacterium]|nr:MBL fold metallo-hydrolase [Alphaproteobacteria bacterium]